MIRSSCSRPVGLLLVVLLAVLPAAVADDNRPAKSALKTVIGVVESVGEAPGEGGIDVVRVELVLEGKEGGSLTLLLAPGELMEEIRFTVAEGDRLKVKYFLDDEGPARAHKVLNVTRGSMVRFRTLRQVPLWTNQGAWQGGTPRTQPGRGGGGGHGGRN